MRPLPGLHTSYEAPASPSPSSRSMPRSPYIEVDAVTPETEHAHVRWLSRIKSSSSAESSGAESSGAESSGAEEREASGGEVSESILQIQESATATDMEASVPPVIVSTPARRPGLLRPSTQPIMPGGQLIAPPQRRLAQQGCSAVSSLSPSSSALESIGEDDSYVHPSHQTAPVRQTERGTAVAAVQFLKLLHALDPSTGNLTTAQLTKDVTPRAAPAKPEHLRSRTPARPEAIPAPEAAAPAEPAAPAKSEPARNRPRRMSAEQHSAHTEEMMLLHLRRPGVRRSRAQSMDEWSGEAMSRQARPNHRG